MMNEAAARSPRIRVLIVAADDLFRGGLASLLAEEPDIEIVAEAPNGHSGVQLASELRPDVALLSLPLPDLKGSDATRATLQRSPISRVLGFTAPPTKDEPSTGDHVEGAIRAGASGFLARDTPIDEILRAVRAAAADSRRLVHRTTEEVLAAVRRSDAARRPPSQLADELSKRELELLRLLARGLDNDEIAETLKTSVQRVEKLVWSILAKLRGRGR